MINRELIQPQSIVVVGGSNNAHKPGGRLVRNLLDGHYICWTDIIKENYMW